MTSARRIAPWLFLAATTMGCGAKTGLDPHSDGSVDGDAAPVGVEAICPERDLYTSPRRTVTLEGSTRSVEPIVAQGWSIVSAPAGSTAVPVPPDAAIATLTADQVGDYVVRFTAEDALGQRGSCDVTVHSVVGPPVAICPEEPELRTGQGEPLAIEGDAYDDDGVVSYAWRILEMPPLAMPVLSPVDAPSTTFVSTVPGRYLLELLVTDVDGATGSCNVAVRVTAPPVVECPAEEIAAPTRRLLRIRARATDDTAIRMVSWVLREQPAGSTATLSPTDAEETTMTPDRVGTYVLVFTATDEDGLSASCEVRVRATPTPPDAICPGTITTEPLREVVLDGMGLDDGTIVAFRWELVRQPVGSAADPPTPASAARSRFTPDVAGEYIVRLTVTDDHGNRASCDVLVRAVPQEGLRVEIFWNGPPDRSCDTMPGPGCDPTDVDLHLLRPGTEPWFHSGGDCHWANCTSGRRLDWFTPAVEDDPHLDIDDVEGFGPENVNVDRPAAGTYRVGVDFWAGDARNTATVTVNIYCGTGSTMPVATFGPVTLRTGTVQDQNDFWRVADVEIGSGIGCTVRDLATAAGPSIITHGTARSTR